MKLPHIKKSHLLLLLAGAFLIELAAMRPLQFISSKKTPPTTIVIPFKDTLAKPPALKLSGYHQKEEKEPSLHTLKINVEVIGRMAVTTMDMTFYNENNRVMEGELEFPLGEGQTVSRFALEVNDKLREGVVVDKNKGQKVFEELIRQKVDPGLLELVQGNTYKARVYPIPAKGYKRLILAYEQELPMTNNEPVYYLPLNYRQFIPDFALHIEVEATQVRKNSDGIQLEYRTNENKTIADYQTKNYNATSFLAFAVAETNEDLVFAEAIHGSNYFYAPLAISGENTVKNLPSSVALIWDASGSSASRNKEKELQLLKSYFALKCTLKVTVVSFANSVLEEKDFILTPSNFSELENYLKQIPCDGATQWNCLDFNKYPVDEILLCSDGLSDFGKVDVKASSKPIYTITSTMQSDFNLLNYTAMSTGGKFLNLNLLSASEALEELKYQSLQVIEIKCEQSESVGGSCEIYPGNGSLVNNHFAVVGKTDNAIAELNVIYGYGNKVTGEKKIKIKGAPIEKYHGLVKRVWAQKKLNDLMLQPDKNKDAIINCSVENGVVTPFTSLLVLDRVEDYVRYEVSPPDELKAEYETAMTSKKKEEKVQLQQQLERISNLFSNRKHWWNNDYVEVQKKVRVADSIEIIRVKNKPLRAGTYSTHAGTEVVTWTSSGNASYEVNNDRNTYYSTASNATASAPMRAGEVPSFLGSRANGPNKPRTPSAPVVTTELANWDPNTPYMAAMNKAIPANAYNIYLNLKKDYGHSVSFYLDIADYFFKQNNTPTALRILSNLAEIDMQNYRLLRVLAQRLSQAGRHADAVAIFKMVLELRKEEPQSFRDLGLELAKNNQEQEAIAMLYEAVTMRKDGRFPEIELIILNEMNNIIATAKKPLDTRFIDSRFIANMPLEARVILNWDADNCDIDLWVTDPRGEKCFYGNRDTKIGGHNSADFTGGYGPEEFIIKTAMKGTYTVEINYFGTREQTVLGPTTVQLEMYTQYGKPEEKVKQVTRRLESKKETIKIGTFEVK